MNNENTLITRRTAMKQAAALLGSTATVTCIGPILSRAANAATEGSQPEFFSEDQFALLEHIVDVMIPQTDTPGAQMIGVHHFIDLMLSEWAGDERQTRFVDGMQQLQEKLRGDGGDRFATSSRDQQLVRLAAYDKLAYAEGSSESFYQELKRLVLFSYYSSEEGATIELQYEPMQADYKACVPINEIGRAWFWLGFSHGL